MSKLPTSALARAADHQRGRRSAAITIALLSAFVLFLVLFPWFPGAQSYEAGSLVERDILAPRDLTFESDVLTERVRQEAVDAVAEVRVLDPEIRERQLAELERITDRIDEVRTDETLSASARELAIAAIQGTDLSQRSTATLASASDVRWEVIMRDAVNALTRTMTGSIDQDDVAMARSRAAGFLSPQLTTDEALAVTELLDPLIVPTLMVDAERTEALRQEALANTRPVRVSYIRGDVVVPAGTVLEEADVEAIQRLEIRASVIEPRLLVASALASLLAGAAIGAHVLVMRPRSLQGVRRITLLLLLLIVPLAIAKFALPPLLPDEQRYFLAHAIPLAAGPIVAAVLLDVTSAILIAVLLASLVGYTSAYLPAADVGGQIQQLDTLRLILTTAAGSLAGVYVAARAERLQHYLAAGFAVALASGVAMLAVLLIDPARSWADVPWLVGTAIGGGLLAAMISVGAFILLSRPFGIITRVELMELVQLSHPLLRRLQDEAPGTFQHSMLVGNLAERAADRIGADSLLVRVGAYYHDIGKLVSPSFFVENFGPNENPHEHLDPLQSTRVIHQHVTAGVEIARKERLPEAVIQFIPQHHGERLVAFFYRRAAQQTPDISPELFRYPGPRPQSRETALVMIADACEASVRASNDRSAERIRAIVEGTIRERIEEGEFDECDLSLRDLRIIADTYTTTLNAMFHPRVQYPEPTRQELAARRERGGVIVEAEDDRLIPPPRPRVTVASSEAGDDPLAPPERARARRAAERERRDTEDDA